MTEGPAKHPSNGASAEDPWTRVETAYRLAVEADELVALLAVEPLDLTRLCRENDVRAGAVLASLARALRALPGARDAVSARRKTRLVAVLPGATLARAEELAAQLVASCRELALDGGEVRVHAVAGLSHLEHGTTSLEVLARVAEEGAQVAGFRGPGGVVHTKVYGSIERQVRREAEDGAAFAPAPLRGVASRIETAVVTPARPASGAARTQESTADDRSGSALESRVRAMVAREAARELGDPEDGAVAAGPARSASARPAPRGADEGHLDEVCRRITERVLEALRPHAGPSDESAAMLRLRRRVAKLTDALEQTERRLAAMEQGSEPEVGLASAFQSVQGLTGSEHDFELRKSLLRELLEANLELQGAIEAERRAEPRRAARPVPGNQPPSSVTAL